VAVAAILGGAIASGTHVAKAGTRALINTSPEPFSNWVASFGEEAMLLGGLWMMIQHPLLFLAALALFILLLIWLIPRVFRAMRGIFRPRTG
jgi:RsiW-degrading membrane proteinase PrsW (M82 family)